MLNIQSFQNKKEIDAQDKDIDIFIDDEKLFGLSFELPPPAVLLAKKCVPVARVNIHEIASQDPFNFQGIFRNELSSLSKKRERFKGSPTFALKIAGVASLSGDLDTAEQVLNEAISVKSSQKLLHKLGDTLILKGDETKARSIFEHSDLQKDIYSNLRIAYLHVKSNDLNNALRYLENAQHVDPSDFRTRMFLGAIHLNSGQCEMAIRNFRVASLTKRDSSTLYVNLAASHLSLGHVDKAIKELRKAIAINPINENALIFYSDILFQTNKNEKAIPSLELYVKLNQKSRIAWERLARAYYFSSNFSKAKYALLNQLDLFEEPSVLNNLGLVCWQLGERVTAAKFLAEAVNKVKSDKQHLAIPLLNMAIVFNETRQYKECFGLLKEFVYQNNENIDGRILVKIILQYLAALEGMDNLELATKAIDYFIRLPIHDVEGKATLLVCKIYYDAVINRNIAECDKTTRELLKLIDNNNEAITEEIKMLAFNNITFNFLINNNINIAQQFLRKIIKYVGKDPFCTATYGLFCLKRGDYEKGAVLYEEAVSLALNKDMKDKIRQRMCLELGKQMISAGNFKEGIRNLEKAAKENRGLKYVASEAKSIIKSASF